MARKPTKSTDVAKFLCAEHVGPSIVLTGVSTLNAPRHSTLIWSKALNAEKLSTLGESGPVFAIVPEGCKVASFSAVRVEAPRAAFSACLREFFVVEKKRGISETASVGKDVKIAQNVSVGAGSVIQGDLEIGDNVVIDDNVTIVGPGRIGNDTEILSGARIGVDSLALTQDASGNSIMPQIGGFVIGARCRVGVNSIIARGTIDDTVVEDNVMLGERVLIGHNSLVGRGSVLTAGAIICGSVTLGQNTWIGPSATVLQGVSVAAEVKLAAGAVLFKNARRPGTYMGNPAKRFSIGESQERNSYGGHS